MKFKMIGLVLLSVIFVQAAELTQEIESCKIGDIDNCYKAGTLLTTGENAEDQEKKELGLDLIRKACKYGHKDACTSLGENYYKDKHYFAAKPYLLASCKEGLVNGCNALGTMYRDGQDVAPDDTLSRTFYEKACSLGSKDACINVAIIYRGGFGVDKNRSQEKAYYKKACKAGSTAGCDSFTTLDDEDKGIEPPSMWSKFKSLFN